MNSFEEFVFYPLLDSLGNDIEYVGKKNIEELKELSRNNSACVGFNTIGNLKSSIGKDLKINKYYSDVNDGLYINIKRYNQHVERCNYLQKKNHFRARLICNDADNLIMNTKRTLNIELTTSNEYIDFYVFVMNNNSKLLDDCVPIPSRTILFLSSSNKYKNCNNVLKTITCNEDDFKNELPEDFYSKLSNIFCDHQFTFSPSDEEIVYHKTFKNFEKDKLENVCFIHSCTLNNNKNMLDELVYTIVKTGLYSALDKIFVINLGNTIEPYQNMDKIVVINYSSDSKLFELPAINLLNVFSKFHPMSKILYLYTKETLINQNSLCIEDWKNLMLYFLVEQHVACLKLLDKYDAVGINYLDEPFKKYDGNFWWARCSYLKKLPQLMSGINQKHDVEFWVLQHPEVKHVNIYNSNVNHFHNRYPRYIYDTNEIKRKINNN
jgi:hypothetical protein